MISNYLLSVGNLYVQTLWNIELSSYLYALRSHDMEEVFINQEPRLYNT